MSYSLTSKSNGYFVDLIACCNFLMAFFLSPISYVSECILV